MRGHLACLFLLAIAMPAQSQVPSTSIRRDREAVLDRSAVLDRGVVLDRGMIAKTPSITQATPGSAQQGQKNVAVGLTGSFTNFAAGTTIVSFGPGVTLAAPLTVTSPTSATAVVNIDPGTPSGARTITLTTGQEVATIANGLTVTPRPDGFGNVCNIPTNLGTLNQGMSKEVTGQLYAHGVEDWFQVTFGAGTTLTLTLRNVQPGSDFDIDARSACFNAPLASTTAGAAPKTLVLADSGPHTVLIRVRGSQWDVAHPTFTLSLVAN